MLLTGPFRIYRVPGSVSFLSSGSFLQAILPRSKCWCVDQESIFVFRKGDNSYYRIELPNDSDEDKERVKELKSIFNQVLLYDKTPSPFEEDASNQLPKEPETPTPRGRLRPTGKARKWKHDRFWRPAEADGHTPVLHDAGNMDYSDSDASTTASISTGTSASTGMGVREELITSESTSPNLGSVRSEDIKLAGRPKGLATVRSITAPPQMLFQTSPPLELKEQDNEASLSSSLDSFHSVTSEVYHPADDELQPSLETSRDEQTPTLAPPSHEYKVTVTAEANASSEPVVISSPLDDDVEGSVPSTPTLISDTEEHPDSQPSEIITPPDTLRLRHNTRARYRSASPFPQDPTTFLIQTRPQNRHLPGMIIRKTYEILTSPPAHLVSIMLEIAARIARTIGLAAADFESPSTSKIPCSWESEEGGIDWDEEEDDAFELKPLERSRNEDSE